ncbi:hypothetical protein TNCV_4535611 [Trichonephila clavipes]|nr:hypothetical protein TNCV_4535611 [Trichonephila clavipes]
MDHEEVLTYRTLQNLQEPDIVKFVELQRLKWAGHLARMNEDCCCKKIFLAKLNGKLTSGETPIKMD